MKVGLPALPIRQHQNLKSTTRQETFLVKKKLSYTNFDLVLTTILNEQSKFHYPYLVEKGKITEVKKFVQSHQLVVGRTSILIKVSGFKIDALLITTYWAFM